MVSGHWSQDEETCHSIMSSCPIFRFCLHSQSTEILKFVLQRIQMEAGEVEEVEVEAEAVVEAVAVEVEVGLAEAVVAGDCNNKLKYFEGK